MRRIITMLTAAAMLAAMLMVGGPASAQGGCKEFGTGVAENVQTGTLRDEIPNLAPVNDEVHSFQEVLCG